MNEMTRRPATAEEEDMAAEIIIPAAELHRLYQERKQEQARESRRQRRNRLLSGGTIIVLLLVIGALASAITFMLPLEKLVPIVVYQRGDGTVVNTLEWASLPREVQEDTTVNVVWNYVQQRESWSEGNAGWAWTVVSAMSSPSVRDAFQSWYRKENPDSPARLYKDGTTVDARYVNWAPVCPPEEGCKGAPPAYRIWFDRVETSPSGAAKPPVRFAVTVRIVRNVPLPKDRIWQRWTFNAPLVQVVEYPGAQREGVTR
jgi:type IV secretory pathway component VirB8